MQLSTKILPNNSFSPKLKGWRSHPSAAWEILDPPLVSTFSLRYRYRYFAQIHIQTPVTNKSHVSRFWTYLNLSKISLSNLFHLFSFISLHVSRNWTHASGGSKGVPPARAPLTDQNFLNLLQFLEKFVCWRLPMEGWCRILLGILDPPLHPI